MTLRIPLYWSKVRLAVLAVATFNFAKVLPFAESVVARVPMFVPAAVASIESFMLMASFAMVPAVAAVW